MRRQRPLEFAVLTIGIAVIGYLAVSTLAGGNEVIEALSRLHAVQVLFVLCLSLFNYLVRAVRWQGYLTELGAEVPLGSSLLYYFAGFSLTTTPGKLGEAVRSVYLSRHGVSYDRSLAMLFVERLSDLAAMIVLSTVALVRFPQYRIVIGIAVLVCLSLIFLVRERRLLLCAYRELRSRARGPAALRRMLSLAISASALTRTGRLAGGLGLGLIAWSAEGVGFYYLLQFMHADLSLGVAVSIYAVSMLIGALSFLPGGIGSTEASMMLLLALAGVDHADAVAATLVCRLATLWFAVALGGLAMMGVAIGRPYVERPSK